MMLLRTLGTLALVDAEGAPVRGLRRKDLALLAYLCVEHGRPHSRARLAALMWGEHTESQARHSLTQALVRVRRVVGRDVVAMDQDMVSSTGWLDCDASPLLADVSDGPRLDDALSLYAGQFLDGFDAGPGAEEFDEWAGRRRADLRSGALRVLERRGERAEAAGEWERALHAGEAAVRIDPVSEQGHRRVMRALTALGEKGRAMRHYREFAAWLLAELGAEPDPDTRRLAEQLDSSQPEKLETGGGAKAKEPSKAPGGGAADRQPRDQPVLVLLMVLASMVVLIACDVATVRDARRLAHPPGIAWQA